MLALLDAATPAGALRIEADPLRPEKAIEFFAAKTPLPKTQWLDLSEQARKRAFTVAWTTNVRVLQGVKTSIDRAVANGESFESWKTQIRKEMGEKWKRTDAYLETVFRNNVQSAYAAGRYAAQTTPTMLRVRPFWRLVVIEDTRTSPECKPYISPPLVLPAEDPWWATNYVPRHNRCRSTVVTMSRRQAERVGITKTRPKVAAQDGWGSTASLGDWQPGGAGIDPEIFNAAKSAAARAEPVRVAAPAPPEVAAPQDETPTTRPKPTPVRPAASRPAVTPAVRPAMRRPVRVAPAPATPVPSAPAAPVVPIKSPRPSASPVAVPKKAPPKRPEGPRLDDLDALELRGIEVFADDPSVISRRLRAMFPGGVPTIDAVEALHQPPPGYTVAIDTIRSVGTGVQITYKFNRKGETGEGVAYATRTWKPITGGLKVEHGVFRLPVGMQGKGFGQTVLRNALRGYKAMGIKEVTLDAAYVGRYTWASFGFQWSADTARNVAMLLKMYLTQNGIDADRAQTIAAGATRRPFDLAALTIDGVRHGKAFLLSPMMIEWSGKLVLDDADIGYQRARERLGLDVG